tara:strand:+ start:164 stop:358 length:195 start_codon:yes stop_codon:yes gene_type:complete
MSDRFRISRPHGKVRGLNKRGYAACGWASVDEQNGGASSSLRGRAESGLAVARRPPEITRQRSI